MKVNIELQQTVKEPYAVIYTNRITDEIAQLADMIGKDGQKDRMLLLEQEEKYVVVRPEELYMVRFEENRVVLYSEAEKYVSGQRLYQIEEQLGNQFIRISKTTIIHAKYMKSVEPSFNGTMKLKLKNGLSDYVSRKYLPILKKHIGL